MRVGPEGYLFEVPDLLNRRLEAFVAVFPRVLSMVLRMGTTVDLLSGLTRREGAGFLLSLVLICS